MTINEIMGHIISLIVFYRQIFVPSLRKLPTCVTQTLQLCMLMLNNLISSLHTLVYFLTFYLSIVRALQQILMEISINTKALRAEVSSEWNLDLRRRLRVEDPN